MTPRQRQLLDAIRELTVDGVCPSYEELVDHLGLSNKSEVNRMVVSLEANGWIVRSNRARSIMLTTPEPLDHMSKDGLLALREQIDRRLAA